MDGVRGSVVCRWGVFFLLALIVPGCGQPNEGQNPIGGGQRRFRSGVGLATELANNGFRCSRRNEGDLCVATNAAGKAGLNYSQPVVFLIPTGVESPKRVHLYLHGFRGVCESASATPEFFADEFGLLKQMVEAGGGDSVMVFPMSLGHCETYRNELIPRFTSFAQWVTNQVHPLTSVWTVGGHSGAGAIMSAIFSRNMNFSKNLDSAFLLDATYSMSSHIDEWRQAARANPKIKIYAASIAGTSTATGAATLKAQLPGIRVVTRAASTGSHCLVPTKDYGRLFRESLSWRSEDASTDFE